MMSGFAKAIVGFVCREIRVPANYVVCGINDIFRNCRKCRLLREMRAPRGNAKRKTGGRACCKNPQPIHKIGLE
jgi:hypothetical protein